MEQLANAVVQRLEMSWGRHTYSKGIDPISACIRLGLLNFKELGTKLATYGPKIQLDPPIKIQWSIRRIKVADRNNLSQIKEPLQQLIGWYNMDDPCLRFPGATGQARAITST